MQTEPPAPPTAVAIRINESFDSLLSCNKGATAPPYAVAGTWWLDDSGTPWLLKIYDAVQWLDVAEIDPVNHTLTFSNVLSDITIGDVTGLQTALDDKADDSISITGGGLATGGGALTANRVITVNIASQAQAEAGVANNVGMTPLRTAQAIAALATPAAIGAVPSSRVVTAGAGLSGGGALSANITLALDIDELTEDLAPPATSFIALETGVGIRRKAQLQNIVLPGVVELIAKVTVNDAAVLDLTDLDNSFDSWELHLLGVRVHSSNQELRLRVFNGVVITSSSYSWQYNAVANGAATAAGDDNDNGIELTGPLSNDSADPGVAGRVYIPSPGTAARKILRFDLAGRAFSGVGSYDGGGRYTSATTIDGLRLYAVSGNITATAVVYGWRSPS